MMNFFKSIITLGLLCFSGCAGHIAFSKGSPKSVDFTIAITDPHQTAAADSLGAELARRLLAYSEETGDFRLVKTGEPAAYSFKIRITSFNLISMDAQVAVNREKKKITGKYDRINDSLLENYTPTNRLSVSKSLVATAVVNVILPAGYYGIAIVRDIGPEWAKPTAAEQKVIDSLSKSANLGFRTELTDTTGKIWWEKSGIESIPLDSQMSEKEQLFLLVRNTVMNFEGKMPFLKLR